jgi:hypothetical protein
LHRYRLWRHGVGSGDSRTVGAHELALCRRTPDVAGLAARPLGSEYRAFGDDTIPFGDGEFDVAVLNDVIHETPEQAARLLAEAARVARYVLVKDRFERESYPRRMLRFTREAFIRLANQQRLVIAAFDSGLALRERSAVARTLVQSDPNFVAVLCRG